MNASLPGFDSPAVGFEQPFEMLEACHERVQRSLALLQRLIEHVDAEGHDARSRSAAADVLRYFDLAAPLHHEDEEQHVFPPLLAAGDPTLTAAVQQLQRDHAEMSRLWQRVRVVLLAWRDDPAPPPTDDAFRRDAAAFAGIYAGHIETEEGHVFPAARAATGPTAIERMSAAMQQRRQQR